MKLKEIAYGLIDRIPIDYVLERTGYGLLKTLQSLEKVNPDPKETLSERIKNPKVSYTLLDRLNK